MKGNFFLGVSVHVVSPKGVSVRRMGVSVKGASMKGVSMKGDRTPLVMASSGIHQSGKYTSYWNAFLFVFLL